MALASYNSATTEHDDLRRSFKTISGVITVTTPDEVKRMLTQTFDSLLLIESIRGDDDRCYSTNSLVELAKNLTSRLDNMVELDIVVFESSCKNANSTVVDTKTSLSSVYFHFFSGLSNEQSDSLPIESILNQFPSWTTNVTTFSPDSMIDLVDLILDLFGKEQLAFGSVLTISIHAKLVFKTILQYFM
jgi:hypothetical protein